MNFKKLISLKISNESQKQEWLQNSKLFNRFLETVKTYSKQKYCNKLIYLKSDFKQNKEKTAESKVFKQINNNFYEYIYI